MCSEECGDDEERDDHQQYDAGKHEHRFADPSAVVGLLAPLDDPEDQKEDRDEQDQKIGDEARECGAFSSG